MGSATQGESLERIERKISRFHEDMCLLSQIQVEIAIENQHGKMYDLALKERIQAKIEEGELEVRKEDMSEEIDMEKIRIFFEDFGHHYDREMVSFSSIFSFFS